MSKYDFIRVKNIIQIKRFSIYNLLQSLCFLDIVLFKNIIYYIVLFFNILEIYLYQMLYIKYILFSFQKKEIEKGIIELDKVIKRWVLLNVRYMECKIFIVIVKNNYDKIYFEK